MRSRKLPVLSPAVATMAATLGSWLTSWWIAQEAGLRSDVIVLGTVLPVALSRVVARRAAGTFPARLLRLVEVPVVALAASEVGVLLSHHRWLGGGIFVLVLTASIWVRRFGTEATTAGALVALPFVVLLVSPVAPAPGHEHTLWPAAIGLVALAWVVLVHEAAWRLGAMPRPAPASSSPPPAPGKLPASTRMAAQMGVALAASYALGTWWFPEHWAWMVLSAFVVLSGSVGRGDVLHKGWQRLVGASAGTVGATLLANSFPTGDRRAVAILFVVMGLAVWLRPVAYAFWAAGVTAMLALLHGYYGEHGASLILDRLAGVVAGAAIGVLAAWFVLPIRSRDVLRRRVGAALTAFRDDDLGRFTKAVGEAELLAPAHRLHRRVTRSRGDDHPAALIDRLAAVRAEWARTGRRDRRMGEEMRAVAAVLREMRPPG